MDRDEQLLNRRITEWEKQDDQAKTQINYLKGILQQVQTAKEFLKTLTKEAVEELKEPLSWRKYEELSYVFAMNELF